MKGHNIKRFLFQYIPYLVEKICIFSGIMYLLTTPSVSSIIDKLPKSDNQTILMVYFQSFGMRMQENYLSGILLLVLASYLAIVRNNPNNGFGLNFKKKEEDKKSQFKIESL